LELFTLDGLNAMPGVKLDLLISYAEQALNNFDRIHNYQKAPSEPDDMQRVREGLYFRKAFKPTDSDGFALVMHYLWPLVTDSLTIAMFRNSRGSEHYPVAKIQSELAEVKSIKLDFDTFIKNAKSELTQHTVSNHAVVFANQAKKHMHLSLAWGAAAAVVISANIIVIYTQYCKVEQTAAKDPLPIAVMSFLLISILSYLIVQCVKSFFAEKHNQVVNQHKANCLQSFNTFVGSANDDIKNVILQYTAQTIFSSFNPGFLSKDLMSSPMPIVEILKTVQTERKSPAN
jgi:hypothetical protein